MRPWLITLASTLIIPRIWENPNSIIVLLYIVSWKLYKNSLWSDKTVFLNKYWGKFVKNSTRARKNDLSLLSYKVTGPGKTFSVTTTRLVTSASTDPFQNQYFLEDKLEFLNKAGELMVWRQEYKNCLCENTGWQNSWRKDRWKGKQRQPLFFSASIFLILVCMLTIPALLTLGKI